MASEGYSQLAKQGVPAAATPAPNASSSTARRSAAFSSFTGSSNGNSSEALPVFQPLRPVLPLPKLKVSATRQPSMTESRPASPAPPAQEGSRFFRLPAVLNFASRSKGANSLQESGSSECRSPISTSASQLSSSVTSAPSNVLPTKASSSVPAAVSRTPTTCFAAPAAAGVDDFGARSAVSSTSGGASLSALHRTRSQPPPILLASAASLSEEAIAKAAAAAAAAAAASSVAAAYASEGGRSRTAGSAKQPPAPDKEGARAAAAEAALEAAVAAAIGAASASPQPPSSQPIAAAALARGAASPATETAAAPAATAPAALLTQASAGNTAAVAKASPNGAVAAAPAAAAAGTASSAAAAASLLSADTQQSASVLLATSPATPPEMQRPVWRLDDYSFLSRPYKGPISAVYKARCTRSGTAVALKVYVLDAVPPNTMHMLVREIQIHSSLAHPNIAALYGAFQEGKYLVMVQEWAARGDLHSVHRARGRPLSEEQLVQVVLAPFLAALTYLHARGICHRDIKPENILFTADWKLLLADFGVSIDLARERAVTRTGTLDYMAPEVSRCPIKSRATENKERLDLAYTYAADVWSTGILAYELLLGFPPFADGVSAAAAAAAAAAGTARGSASGQPPASSSSSSSAAAASSSSSSSAKAASAASDASLRLLLPPPLPRNLSAGARDFIRAALAADPAERPSALQLLKHPWVAAGRGEGAATAAAAAAATGAQAQASG